MARKTLVALYDETRDAEAARDALEGGGFADLSQQVVAEGCYGAASGGGELVPRLIGWGVPDAQAAQYAEGVREGGALLVASFGSMDDAERAIPILNRPNAAPQGFRP